MTEPRAPSTARAEPWRQAHIDIGGLAERVTGTERQLSQIDGKVDRLSSDTTSQINSLASSFSNQFQALSVKIDRQQESFGASRATNWQSLAAIAGVLLSIGGIVVSQMNSNISRNDAAIETIKATRFSHQDATEMAAGFTHWIDKVQAEKVSREEYTEALSDLKLRVASLEGAIVKRPEIEATNKSQDERITALSVRQNGFETWLQTVAPSLGDVIKEMQTRLDRLTFSPPQSFPAIAPIAPIAPTTPPHAD